MNKEMFAIAQEVADLLIGDPDVNSIFRMVDRLLAIDPRDHTPIFQLAKALAIWLGSEPFNPFTRACISARAQVLRRILAAEKRRLCRVR